MVNSAQAVAGVSHPRLAIALLKRTPTPPPFSSMNAMPASSSARRIAMSFAGINDVTPSVNSARRIVVTPTEDDRARSSALHRIRERAARICALVSGAGLDLSIPGDIFHSIRA